MQAKSHACWDIVVHFENCSSMQREVHEPSGASADANVPQELNICYQPAFLQPSASYTDNGPWVFLQAAMFGPVYRSVQSYPHHLLHMTHEKMDLARVQIVCQIAVE